MVPLCNSIGHCVVVLEIHMEMSMDFGSPIVSLSPFKTVSLSRKNREGCRIFFSLGYIREEGWRAVSGLSR